MLIGLGHDLQAVAELIGKDVVLAEGGCFTTAEAERIAHSRSPAETAAGLFAAKEAFLKAVPSIHDGFWTDIEVTHSAAGAPLLVLHGAYRELFERRRWKALLSLSHSGGFASSIVVVFADAPVAAAET